MLNSVNSHHITWEQMIDMEFEGGRAASGLSALSALSCGGVVTAFLRDGVESEAVGATGPWGHRGLSPGGNPE